MESDWRKAIGGVVLCKEMFMFKPDTEPIKQAFNSAALMMSLLCRDLLMDRFDARSKNKASNLHAGSYL